MTNLIDKQNCYDKASGKQLKDEIQNSCDIGRSLTTKIKGAKYK